MQPGQLDAFYDGLAESLMPAALASIRRTWCNLERFGAFRGVSVQ
jgi:hypothetical protein